MVLAVKGWWSSTVFSELRDASHFPWSARQRLEKVIPTFQRISLSLTLWWRQTWDASYATSAASLQSGLRTWFSLGDWTWFFFAESSQTSERRRIQNNISCRIVSMYKQMVMSDRVLCMLHRLCMLCQTRATPIQKIFGYKRCERIKRVFSIWCLLFHRQ